MSSCCPHRHISYATWRLNVLRDLFKSANEPLPPPRDPTSPHNISTSNRNYSRASSSVKRQTTQSTQEKDSRRDETLKASSKGKAVRKDFSPYSPEGRQAVTNLLQELEDVSRRLSHGDTAENSVVDHVSLKKQRGPSGNLKDDTGVDEAATGRELPQIFQSPVLRGVQTARRRRNGRKVHPMEFGIAGLKHNEWAEMLSAPLRACSASGARLPASMLLDFGNVKDPNDTNLYLMPGNLANLEALELELSDELAKGQQASAENDASTSDEEEIIPTTNVSDADHSPPTSAVEDDAAATAPLQRRQTLPNVCRPLANITFMQHLSNTLTQPAKTPPSPDRPVAQRKSIFGEVGKLLGYDKRQTHFTAHHYSQLKRRVEAASDGATGSEVAPSGKTDDSFNLTNLHWQFDMPTRIAHIMRQRVLVALEALVSAKGKVQPRYRRSLFSLHMPQTASISAEESLPLTFRSTITSAATVCDAEEQSRRAEDKVERSTHPTITGTTSRFASDMDLVPSPEARPPLDRKAAMYNQLGHPQWLPGSMFLHVGMGSLESLRTSAGLASSTLPPLPSSENQPLLPPMISVDDTYRFPVFSLYPLFSHHLHSNTHPTDLTRLEAMIARYSKLQSPKGYASHSTDANNHLLLLRPASVPAKLLIREIWQLWRYLGGENMNMSFFEDDGADTVKKAQNAAAHQKEKVFEGRVKFKRGMPDTM